MIKILPQKMVGASLIRRLLKVLTEEEKIALGYVEIIITSRGKTRVEPIEEVYLTGKKTKEGNKIIISFFSVVAHFNYLSVSNPYHEFNDRFAGHLYWGIDFILNRTRTDKTINYRLGEIFVDIARKKGLLEVHSFKEYGLFGLQMRKYIDVKMALLRKEKKFAKGYHNLINQLRKRKLGKNVKYSAPELYRELFCSFPYKTKNDGYYSMSNEYNKFYRKVIPKLPAINYTTKKGRKFLFFKDNALKKAYEILMKDFNLFCCMDKVTTCDGIYTEDRKITNKEEQINYLYNYDFKKLKERYNRIWGETNGR